MPGSTKILVALAFSALAARAPAQRPDNVLLIIADDLGVDHVGIYKESRFPAPTPNIDALARRGVLFRNAWSYPVCAPARAAINTGRYGYRTGVGWVPGILPTEETTIPERLDAMQSGYAHAWIGKWHLGLQRDQRAPLTAGWSHFAGILGGMVTSYTNWQRNVNGKTSTSTTYATTQMVNDALAWIGAQKKPWLCVLAFNAPHTPFHAPPSNLHTRTLRGRPNLNPLPFYQAAVEAMDTEIGRLLRSLGTKLQTTNVIFIGDNGTPRRVPAPGFPAGRGKGTPYEDGVNVPLIFAGPAVKGAPREVAALVDGVDVFATVLDLTGTDPHPPFSRSDAVSFLPYLAHPKQSPLRGTSYHESFARSSNPDTNGWVAARNARYKMIRRFTPTKGDQLYDLQADPFETRDLLQGNLTTEQRVNRDALLAHILAVRDTSGGFRAIGSSTCAGSNGIPTIAGAGTPRIGTAYDVSLSHGARSRLALLVVGASSARFAGLPLPIDLSGFGAGPGCKLHVSAEFGVPSTTSAAGTASFRLVVPNATVLIGGTIYHTWVLDDRAAPRNTLGITTTSGLAARLGR